MLLNVLDADGNAQTIIVQAQGVPVDRSGAVAAEATAQEILGENAARSGWLFQNLSLVPMWVNDCGQEANPAVVAGNASHLVPPGASFPPCGYVVTPGPVSLYCEAAEQLFGLWEW